MKGAMNIVLIGFRGTGKTTIGNELAKKLKRDFISTDAEVEKREGKTINEIVDSGGWGRFRELEREATDAISKMDNCIIDTGGGTILYEENLNKLKKKGVFVLLEAEKGVIIKRIKRKGDEKRPSLTGKGVAEEAEELLAQRNAKYKNAADFAIDTSEIEKAEEKKAVVEKIILFLEKRKVV